LRQLRSRLDACRIAAFKLSFILNVSDPFVSKEADRLMTPYLSVVIPAFNEEQRITQTLSAIYDYLQKQDYEWEVLVVIDGAQDNTLARTQEFAAGRQHIRWIDRKQNRGKGYTVREGMLAAIGRVRLFTDADNSISISNFDKMAPLFRDGYDLAICSRHSGDVTGALHEGPQSRVKRILRGAGNLFIQSVALPGIWDTQCGFKAFSDSLVERIFPIFKIDGWGFDIEALALARYLNSRIGIVPARWSNRPGTHLRPAHYFDVLYETVKVRWNLMTGVYAHELRQAGLQTNALLVDEPVGGHANNAAS
jgi:dolichyl-phosphate beta-glucosyltransferase